MFDDNSDEPDRFFIDYETWVGKLESTQANMAMARELSSDAFLSAMDIKQQLAVVKNLSVDEYIDQILTPVERASRPSAKVIINRFKGRVVQKVENGPLYAVEIELSVGGSLRTVGVISQNREVDHGVWKPEHHRQAQTIVRMFCRHAIPIITFIDTPGADASTQSNMDNQAHTISHLIAEMGDVHVPTLGVIYGLGYSGGAIPFANANLLLAVRSCAFSTIQPKGLASIARQYNLSWQESARYVGMSAVELYRSGIVDGVINWSPDDENNSVDILAKALLEGIDSIEKNVALYVRGNGELFTHYRRHVNRLIDQPEAHRCLKESDATSIATDRYIQQPNIFGYAHTHLRFTRLRQRIVTDRVISYGRLSGEEMPKGDLQQRTAQMRQTNFQHWLDNPEQLVYLDDIAQDWRQFENYHDQLHVERGVISTLFLGEPQKNYDMARYRLCFTIGLHLYNHWKADARVNFQTLKQLLVDDASDKSMFKQPIAQVNLTDVIFMSELRTTMIAIFDNMVIFDALYDSIVDNFVDIATETRHNHVLSEQTMHQLLQPSLTRSVEDGDSASNFTPWLNYLVKYKQRGLFLATVEEWKRIYYPRLSDALLVLLTFFFEKLAPDYLLHCDGDKKFDGRINPVRIGKRKDFWNQLDIAYKDVLIQNLLNEIKSQKKTTTKAFIDHFFADFTEINSDFMSANPINFPGFRLSIDKALQNKATPCGMVTGIGSLNFGTGYRVGVAISNLQFQAGAFDMASAEKLCQLMIECAREALPLIFFISSGGMQTKEGPQALFSMPLINDRLTRFISDSNLPVIVFGFGDCTGGSQASFVTHPLVKTYYFSGTNMPFAGRIVVPSFLPVNAIVANYLAHTKGAMDGLVKHPFFDDLDMQLKDIDESIAIPLESVEEVVERILSGGHSSLPVTSNQPQRYSARELMKPIKQVLIHARGCTAVKLVRIAQQLQKQVVLVASDPDMDALPADMMNDGDHLVCLGGQTSDESYLNAHSVLTIARRYRVDALHPGIGFLSENNGFAYQCRHDYQLNFIGPYATSMQVMGNKSNAIHTAQEASVPVVPGSHGVLTNIESTRRVADEIGYPLLLKAVHGGGGKGIRIVRSKQEIASAFNAVQAEAQGAFGSSDIYLEKFIDSMRHIEVQILRDVHGNTRVLGLRDCSVQRNNQKVIEESASTQLADHLCRDAYRYAEELADKIDYIGAGTIEFIYDLKSEAIYFMEMNTRLQVEHPVTEWTTGISIIAEQFRIAEQQSIEDIVVKSKGYAMEVRITAEKAQINKQGEIDFIPTPGLINEAYIPEYDYLETISIAATGKTISPFYDSLIAQIICYGEDRNQAIERLSQVLAEMTIKGICTNIPLLRRILVDPVFIAGDYDTTYLTDFLQRTDRDTLIAETAEAGRSADDGTGVDSIRIADTNELKVLSPITGIFYTAPSPTEASYVSVGSSFTVSDTLCQIEAMKMFTHLSLVSLNSSVELYSENRYRLVRINRANGMQVNAGDLLFVVEAI